MQRLPLASMRQNSLQLTDWTKGLTMPGKKRGGRETEAAGEACQRRCCTRWAACRWGTVMGLTKAYVCPASLMHVPLHADASLRADHAISRAKPTCSCATLAAFCLSGHLIHLDAVSGLALRLMSSAHFAGPDTASSVVRTPSRPIIDTLQLEAEIPAAMPLLRSPLMSPLRRTGVRGAPQRVTTPAAERHASSFHAASS